MDDFKVIFILAFAVESIWQGLKPAWPNKLKELEASYGIPVDALGCIVLALLLCLGTGADLLAMVGVPLAVPYLGSILTAFLIYRGSNFMHDLLSKFNDFRNISKPITWVEAGKGPDDEVK